MQSDCEENIRHTPMMDVPQNSQVVFFKVIKVIEHRSSQEEPKEPWEPNMMVGPGWQRDRK
jgi:hypothetical protein